jgi:hypothetical protein
MEANKNSLRSDKTDATLQSTACSCLLHSWTALTQAMLTGTYSRQFASIRGLKLVSS